MHRGSVNTLLICTHCYAQDNVPLDPYSSQAERAEGSSKAEMLLQMELSRDQAPAIVALADRLQIKSILKAAESYLVDELCTANAVEILILYASLPCTASWCCVVVAIITESSQDALQSAPLNV